jgi:hypothetical protein
VIQASNGRAEALPGGRDGRFDALTLGGGESLGGEDGQGQGVRAPGRQCQRPVKPNMPDGNAVPLGLCEADDVTGVSREESVSAPA